MFLHSPRRIIISGLPVCSPFKPVSRLGMGGDVWMRRLGPVAPEGANGMHFNNASAALRYLHSLDGGALTKLAHT